MAGVSKHVSKQVKCGTSWHTSHNTKSQGDVLFTYSLPDVEGVYFTKTSDEQHRAWLQFTSNFQVHGKHIWNT